MTLTPSEIVFLCADRFTDSQHSTDITKAPSFTGGSVRVSAERLCVAALRAAILANHAADILLIEWREDPTMRSHFRQMTGAGNGLTGVAKALVESTTLTDFLAKPQLVLSRGAQPNRWPEQTLESSMVAYFSKATPTVAQTIDLVFPSIPISAAGVMRRITGPLLTRNYLRTISRGFGVLQPSLQLTPGGQQLIDSGQIEALENKLAQHQLDTRTWKGLDEMITNLVRSGI